MYVVILHPPLASLVMNSFSDIQLCIEYFEFIEFFGVQIALVFLPQYSFCCSPCECSSLIGVYYVELS